MQKYEIFESAHKLLSTTVYCMYWEHYKTRVWFSTKYKLNKHILLGAFFESLNSIKVVPKLIIQIKSWIKDYNIW